MKLALSAFTFSLSLLAPAAGAVPVGKPAPDFTLQDVSGKAVRLADFKGQYVVLEWVNPGCPYVQMHYDTGNMPRLQQEYAGRKVTWLAVNSTNPNAGDYRKPAELRQWVSQKKGVPSAILMDETGKVGRSYGARTTPHMYIIDPSGRTIYAGAIDDHRSANPQHLGAAKNFVRAALGEALAGRPVSTASTSPYGCTIKY